MTTIADAIKTALTDNWAIGTVPKFINSEDELLPEIPVIDYIYIMGYTLRTLIDPITFTESDKTNTITLMI